jgi:hypothetical protein
MGSFISSTNSAIIEQNVKLARELKTKFAFVYAACISISVMISAHILALGMFSYWKQGTLPSPDYPRSHQRTMVQQ